MFCDLVSSQCCTHKLKMFMRKMICASLQLKTRQGTDLLIQSENDIVVNDWFKALQDTIGNHVSSNTFTLSI